MHVFLTGGTGFVGSYVLRALLEAGHTVRCLMRDKAAPLAVEDTQIERVKGDVTSAKSLTGALQGCEAVIHLVGIIEEQPGRGITFEALHTEGTRHVVAEAQQSEISTFIHMSANGARAEGVSGYQTSKWAAEELVRAAAFDRWTIFRPSILFGDPGPDHPEFATQLVDTLIRPFPILPVFGDGQYRLQPISVQEVAMAFVQALTNEAAWGRSFCAAGPDTFTYEETLDLLARAAGLTPKPTVRQPLWLVRPALQLADPLGVLPISLDQFEMLIEGNTCDASSFYQTFALTPVPFDTENLAYLRA
ncbi:MAG: NAD-dependent epimerase/dehydratase family protein [Bacteroidota bacterium]